MPSWSVVLAGILLLAIAYFLIYPQSLFSAVVVGAIGIYAVAAGFDLPALLTRSGKAS